MDYDPQALEPAWQRKWEKAQAFAPPPPRSGQQDVFVFAGNPFTSGSAHVGHVRSYTICDSYVRYLRARGDAVLFALGFDSFGLPAEMAAIQRDLDPRQWVDRCRISMRALFDRMGFSFHWPRTFTTCEEDIYRWNQWIFLRFHERGLIYKDQQLVHWCDHCQTVLAILQCADGTCWRCHQETRQILHDEWFVRLSAYVERLEGHLAGMDGMDDLSRQALRTLYGRLDGLSCDALLPGGGVMEAFTPHGRALAQAAFLAVSPEHPQLSELVGSARARELAEGLQTRGFTRSSRAAEQMPAVSAGVEIQVPALGRALPVLITPLVDLRYGGGGAFGIPAADKTDAALAQRFALAVPPPGAEEEAAVAARPAHRYSCRDWPVSRNRSWGTPIPIVYCPACGTVPVPDDQLPVRLPAVLKPTGQGNPLAADPSFRNAPCPRCGGPAQRETSTLDCHMDCFHLWVWPMIPIPERARYFLDYPELNRWLPGHTLICGRDAAGQFFSDIRFAAMALADLGFLPQLPGGEPFRNFLSHEMVLMEGRKMSKHLGNTIDPEQTVAEFGADALRLAMTMHGAPWKTINWQKDFLPRSRGELRNVWNYFWERRDFLFGAGAALNAEVAEDEPGRRKLARWRRTAVTLTLDAYRNKRFHLVVKNLFTLLDMIRKFERGARREDGALEPADQAALCAALGTFLRLFHPILPHFTEELWERCGGGGMLATTVWPEVARHAAAEPV